MASPREAISTTVYNKISCILQQNEADSKMVSPAKSGETWRLKALPWIALKSFLRVVKE